MKPIDKFIKTIAKLRSPDGCPWDKEQTHKSLRRHLIEEAYELVEAINKNNSQALMEELGDVLLQVVLHAQIAKENKKFNFNDVINSINKKMVSRHPHVFGDVKVKNSDEVLINWEKLKKEEKPHTNNIFQDIPLSLPALLKALKISKKVSKIGFEWPSKNDLLKTLNKEIIEFKEAITQNNKEKQSEELGDLLFMIVNIARWYKLDPEDSLNNALKKFIKRFNKVKNKVKSNKTLHNISSYKLNKLWKLVKEEEKTT